MTPPSGFPPGPAKVESTAAPRPVVRPAEADDAALLAALHAASFTASAGGREVWSADVMEQLLRGSGSRALIVELDGRPQGLVLVRLAGGEAEILTLGVRADARRRGCGRALMDSALDLCADSGAGRLYLEVADDNLAARTLYQNLGFSHVGSRKAYYKRGKGRPADAFVFAKEIKTSDDFRAGSTCHGTSIGSQIGKT